MYLTLRPFNPSIRRLEFHEVPPRAIRKALAVLRGIAEPLVLAQIVRRVADRWVGFALSQHLQKKFGSRYLSAGRVQTPVLGWVIAREEERRRKKGLIVATLGGTEVRFELEDPGEARAVFARLGEVRAEGVREAEEGLSPPQPFTTGTLLVEASRILWLPPGRAMALSQALFEAGLITYHRTDSPRVSDAGLALARRCISEAFGEEFVRPRRFGEGGAHECIRPRGPSLPRTCGNSSSPGGWSSRTPGGVAALRAHLAPVPRLPDARGAGAEVFLAVLPGRVRGGAGFRRGDRGARLRSRLPRPRGRTP